MDACSAARLNGLDPQSQAQMLVVVYGLDLVEARRTVLRVAGGSESLERFQELVELDPAPHWFQFRLKTLLGVPILIGLGITLWKWHWAPVATVLMFSAGCLLTRLARTVAPRGPLGWIFSVAALFVGMALILYSPWVWVWGEPMPLMEAVFMFTLGPIAVLLIPVSIWLAALSDLAGLLLIYGLLVAVIAVASYWALHVEEGLVELVAFSASLITTMIVIGAYWY
jgi:hypothetical protein